MKKCPRCGYERTDKDDDFISKEECPRCGIYYAKFVEVATSGNGEDTFGAIRKDTHEDEQRGEAQISLDNKTKKCPFCAEVIQSEAIKCKYCGEWIEKKEGPTLDKKDASTGNISTPTGSSSSQQSTVTTQPPKKQNVNENSKFLGDTYPWRRYFARMVDYSTGGLLAVFVVGFIFGLLFPYKVEGLTKVTVFTKASNYLTILIIADLVLKIIWMPIEAVLLSTAGNTFGKLLFGISVRTTSGQILSFSQALERSWGVLLKGMALGIPFVLLGTQYFAYKRLTNTGTTLWDAETDCVVSHINWSTARTMACVGTVITLVFMMGLLNAAFKDHIGQLANFNKMEEPAPADSAVVHKELGDTYTRLGQYKDAIEEYDKSMRLQPSFNEAYNNREVAYFMQGKEAGCHDAQKACELGNCGLLEKAKKMGVCKVESPDKNASAVVPADIQVKPKVIKTDGRFIAYADGTVLDTKTNLMWASKGNGFNVNWYGANNYCENYRGGGHMDWRLPTIKELETLFDINKPQIISNRAINVYHTKLIKLEWDNYWSSDIKGECNYFFNFENGQIMCFEAHLNWDLAMALPVRSVK